jgi:hypothetical protein
MISSGCAARQSHDIAGVFEGSTPCGDMPRIFLKVPSNDSCEFIKWQITLYKPAGSSNTANFMLKATYGLTQPNTQGFSRSASFQSEGQWTITKGSAGNPNAIVYRLVTTNRDSISFVELNKEMVHPLDPSGRLMIGNAGWSYTLSRTDNGVKK